MNFITICLHCLDMRDFHSHMRETPFLDKLRSKSVFIPMGRAQGHHQRDSLNSEMTGQWTARHSDSVLTKEGYRMPEKGWLPKTVLEQLQEAGYEIITCMRWKARKEKRPDPPGSFAVDGGLKLLYLKDEPERLKQFESPRLMVLDEFMDCLKKASGKFYAHIFLRDTHRPWGQKEGLGAIVGKEPPPYWPDDAFCARKAALDRPDEFAALRRRGLAMADKAVEKIFEETKNIKDVTYLVYSNHGEVFDHFRYNLPYKRDDVTMIKGTSHGAYPYEVLYANMQMWVIPNQAPAVIGGIGRSIDIPPTILDLAGVKGGPMDGESMLPNFADGSFPERDRHAENGQGGAMSMVRSDGYKLISTGLTTDAKEEVTYGPDFHKLAVFDLKSDPYEYVNLIETPKGQEVLAWAIKEHASLKRMG